MRNGTSKKWLTLRPLIRNLTGNAQRGKPMTRRFKGPMTLGTRLLLALLAWPILLTLASCATPPPPRVVKCPKFPPRPDLVLPELGSFQTNLNSTSAKLYMKKPAAQTP